MSNNLHVTVEAYGGSDISSTCDELCALATRIDCNVHCQFNDVTLLVHPGTDPRKLEQAWHDERDTKRSYKMASAKP